MKDDIEFEVETLALADGRKLYLYTFPSDGEESEEPRKPGSA